MDKLAGFGAPGFFKPEFESWALEVWFCLELFSWTLTDQPSQEHKESQKFTSGAKRCSQNSAPQRSYSRFTTVFLRSKPGHKELIKFRLV